jgi:Carboxypeptidase regulatory-like domain/TonB dependent receptor
MLKFIAVHKLSRFSKQITASAVHSKINRTNANDSKGLFHMIRFKSAQLCAVSLVALLAAPAAVHAQETTSAIKGAVLGSDGAPVAGAAVLIVHEPSGTRATSVTNAEGVFQASGLRVGGPYKVTVTAANYQTVSINEISTFVGETYGLNIDMKRSDGVEDAIVVTASKLKRSGGIQTGSETTLDRDAIAGVASVSRDIRDIVRRDPLASLDLSNSRAVSIAGQNSRSNRFSVDGLQVADDFGLNNGGLPSTRGPISLEAIEQVSVKAAPFDIGESNFIGGAINVVLRSGTNKFKGSGFYSYNSNDLIGKRSRSTPITLDLTSKNFGGSLGGPIIEDKLFFFGSAEFLRQTEPNLFGITGSGAGNIVPISQTTLDTVINTVKNTYGFDPLGIATSVPEKDDKANLKLDWNITDDHRASLSYLYNNGTVARDQGNFAATVNALGQATNSPSIGLFSNWYTLTEKIHAISGQVNSKWSENFRTEIRVAYKDYLREQVPNAGNKFAQIQVCTDAISIGSTTSCTNGSSTINLGPDVSRQSNEFAQQNFLVTANASLKVGDQTFKLITEINKIDIDNLFLQRTAGDYYFDSVADLIARRANRLRFQNTLSGQIEDARAVFSLTTYSVGLQDTYKATDTLTLQAGVRYDFFQATKNIPVNTNFINRLGFANTKTISGLSSLQPRIGFNWKATDEIVLSGGYGLFAGGSPAVWISNNYSNPGIRTNSVDIQRTVSGANTFNTGTTPTAIAVGTGSLNNVSGNITNILAGAQPFLNNPANIIFAPTNFQDNNFRIPATWKANAKFEYKPENLGFLGDGWKFSADGIYTKVQSSTVWYDARAAVVGTLPDGRPRYSATGVCGTNAQCISNFDLGITSQRKGYSLVGVVSIEKDFEFGLSASASYIRQKVRDVNGGTSSVALSNYGQTVSLDPNASAFGRSNDEITNTLKFSVSYRKEFFGENETRFELFGEHRSGKPFSYTVLDRSPGRSAVFGTIGAADRYLAYIPDVSGINADSRVIYAATTSATVSDPAVFAALQNIILNSVLKDYQGQIAPKNIGTSPSFTKIDLRFSQEFPGFFGDNKFKIYADMENVLNLINPNWGSLRQVAFPYVAQLADISCIAAGTNTCAQYRYVSPRGPGQQLFVRQSLWALRLGARFDF